MVTPTARRLAGFVVAGALAFGVDAGVLWLLVQVGMSPYVGRILSICLAMVVAWYLNRKFTFGIEAPPTFAEFGRYAIVATAVASLNYLVFALLISVWSVTPGIAVALSTGVASLATFAGLRSVVFKAGRAP